jgi:hypothetical protein
VGQLPLRYLFKEIFTLCRHFRLSIQISCWIALNHPCEILAQEEPLLVVVLQNHHLQVRLILKNLNLASLRNFESFPLAVCVPNAPR